MQPMQPGMPPQGGGNEQMDEVILGALQQLLQVAGPQWVAGFLNSGIELAAEGGGEQEQMPPDMMPQGMPPEVMSQGGPQAMPPQTPQVPGSIAPPQRGMMGRRIPN